MSGISSSLKYNEDMRKSEVEEFAQLALTINQAKRLSLYLPVPVRMYCWMVFATSAGQASTRHVVACKDIPGVSSYKTS